MLNGIDFAKYADNTTLYVTEVDVMEETDKFLG